MSTTATLTTALTTTAQDDLDAITEAYREGWEAGDTSDAEWQQEVAEYCRRRRVDFDAAARYLEMPGYRED